MVMGRKSARCPLAARRGGQPLAARALKGQPPATPRPRVDLRRRRCMKLLARSASVCLKHQSECEVCACDILGQELEYGTCYSKICDLR